VRDRASGYCPSCGHHVEFEIDVDVTIDARPVRDPSKALRSDPLGRHGSGPSWDQWADYVHGTKIPPPKEAAA
jgi:hypothetical protein